MLTQRRELLRQVLSDKHVRDGQVVYSLSSSGYHDLSNPEDLLRHRAYFGKELPFAHDGLLDDYFARNAARHPFVELYGTMAMLDIRSGEEICAAAGGTADFWPAFRRAFPRSWGAMSLSAPGFSPDGSQALLYIGQTTGDLSGEGECYFYTRKEATWTRAGAVGIWVS